MVEMFDDRIEITNPGGLVKGLRPEDFGKKSVLRNPNIANLLHRIEYIEKMGTGISKIRKLMKSAGLPRVKFEFNTFFTVTFKRPQIQLGPYVVGKETFGVNFSVKGKRLERMVTILQILHQGEFLRDDQVAGKFKVTTRTIENDIGFLKQHELIAFEGAPKTGKYVLTEKGKALIKKMIK